MKGGLFLPEYSTVPVKVSYNNGDYFETYFYLNAILLDRIEVGKEPKKTSYKSGEKISYEGIDVIVTYQDMSFIVLSNFSCTFDPPKGTEFPELEDITTYSEENEPCLNVSIKYAEGKDEKECTLTLYAITFVLEIKTQPTKIKYYEGENISYSGLVVNAVYSDESVEDVTSQCSFSVEEGKAFDPLTDTDVEISYKGQTCNLTLKEASGGGSGDCTLTITTQPTITGYHEGEEISYEGMVAKIVANDGSNSEFDVTAYCDVSPAEGTSINTDTKAEVKAAPPLTPYIYDYNCGYIANGVWIYENPTNTFIDIYQVKAGHQYYLTLGASVGSRFRAMFTTTDITTITTDTRITGKTVVNVNNPSTYANATYIPSTTGYICVAKDNVGVSNLYSYLFDRSATSQEKTKKANIDLRYLILDSISVTPPPYTTFRVNEILDYTGCEVIAHYTNDFSQDVTANATFSPAAGSLMSRGLNRVNVSYTEASITKTGSFDVEVALLTGLEIVTPPTKVIYAQNETIDYTGIVVNAVYSDSGVSDVTRYVEYSIAAGTVLTDIGGQTITVSYRDSANDTASTELKIKVYEKIVKSLTITPPTRINYRLGDNVDLTGCVVIANYSDDTTADVTNSCVFTPANNSQITNAIDSIAVSYTENEVTVTGEISIEVVTLDYLTLENNGKSSYAIGEALDYSGITATAHYSNGNSKDVTADTVFTPAAGSIITSSAMEILATYTENLETVSAKLTEPTFYMTLLNSTEIEDYQGIGFSAIKYENVYVPQPNNPNRYAVYPVVNMDRFYELSYVCYPNHTGYIVINPNNGEILAHNFYFDKSFYESLFNIELGVVNETIFFLNFENDYIDLYIMAYGRSSDGRNEYKFCNLGNIYGEIIPNYVKEWHYFEHRWIADYINTGAWTEKGYNVYRPSLLVSSINKNNLTMSVLSYVNNKYYSLNMTKDFSKAISKIGDRGNQFSILNYGNENNTELIDNIPTSFENLHVIANHYWVDNTSPKTGEWPPRNCFVWVYRSKVFTPVINIPT